MSSTVEKRERKRERERRKKDEFWYHFPVFLFLRKAGMKLKWFSLSNFQEREKRERRGKEKQESEREEREGEERLKRVSFLFPFHFISFLERRQQSEEGIKR